MKKIVLISLLFILANNIIGQDAIISIPNIGEVENSEVLIPINITSLNNVGSLTLKIKFNSNIISYTGVVENNTITSGFFDTGTTGNSIVTVSWFGSSSINLDGKLFDLKFNYLGGSSPIEFDFIEITNDRSIVYSVDINDGSISDYVNSIDINTFDILKVFSLDQNYPNPFNPSTAIKFSLLDNSMVELTIFNLAGQKVQTLINSEISAGSHKVVFDASELPGGVYFYRIIVSKNKYLNFVNSKKMVLIK